MKANYYRSFNIVLKALVYLVLTGFFTQAYNQFYLPPVKWLSEFRVTGFLSGQWFRGDNPESGWLQHSRW